MSRNIQQESHVFEKFGIILIYVYSVWNMQLMKDERTFTFGMYIAYWNFIHSTHQLVFVSFWFGILFAIKPLRLEKFLINDVFDFDFK